MKNTYVIIGASAAGIAAFNTIAYLDPSSTLIALTKEDTLYNTCLLASYLARYKQEDEIQLVARKSKNAHILCNTYVTALKRKERRVCLASGEEIAYDKLLIATGSTAYVPNAFKEWQKNFQGIFTFYTLEDARALKKYAVEEKVQEAVVIGAGFTGLECADALTQQGIHVKVIELRRDILPGILPPLSAAILTDILHKRGVQIYTQETVQEIIHEGKKIKGVKLASEHIITASLVVYALGSRPTIALAENADIVVKKGIVTDMSLRTSDEHIYAAGDCALINDRITRQPAVSSTWPDALRQGMMAAQAMVGKECSYEGVIKTYVSHLGGYPVLACGATSSYFEEQRDGNNYQVLFVDKDEHLVGFVLGGNRERAGCLKKALEDRLSLSFIKETFL